MSASKHRKSARLSSHPSREERCLEAAYKQSYKRPEAAKVIRGDRNSPAEARTSSQDEQLALGACSDGRQSRVSRGRGGRSVDSKKGHRKRGKRSMGRYPFLAAANALLRDTEPFYAVVTHKERKRKFRRVGQILELLEDQDIIVSTSPLKMTENDVCEFIGWCKSHLDSTTAAHYLKFLDEILQSVGNNAAIMVRAKRKSLIPHVTQKPIRTVPSDKLETLLFGQYHLDDELWDTVGKTSVALYFHTGLRPTELRTARLSDLDMMRGIIVVSNPKGKGRWTNGTESSPVMPGIDKLIRDYLRIREALLRGAGLKPGEVESLFPYITKRGKAGYWSTAMWAKLKKQVEIASGVEFRWKDLRSTYAQRLKDLGAPIEAVSKCLRHTDTKTTERYYARIRNETAFSLVRQVWETPVAKFQFGKIEN